MNFKIVKSLFFLILASFVETKAINRLEQLESLDLLFYLMDPHNFYFDQPKLPSYK